MVKAILWDNDGVLVDTEHLYYQACREVLLRYNISFDEERYIDLFLRKSEGLLAILHENGLTKKLDTAQNWRNKRYSELLLDGIGAIGGVTDTLEILKSRVQMGIVTSCKRAHFDLIHSKNLQALLEVVDNILKELEKTSPLLENQELSISHMGGEHGELGLAFLLPSSKNSFIEFRMLLKTS